MVIDILLEKNKIIIEHNQVIFMLQRIFILSRVSYDSVTTEMIREKDFRHEVKSRLHLSLNFDYFDA